jgi:hypothetical protein
VSKRERQAWLGSIAVNALAAWLFTHPYLAHPEPQEQDMQYVDATLHPDLKDASDSGSAPDECPHKYIGVGFMYDQNTHVILQAPEHLPAYKAGIREGDIIEKGPWRKMEIGAPAYFQVWRGASHHGYMITPQLICYEAGSNQ